MAFRPSQLIYIDVMYHHKPYQMEIAYRDRIREALKNRNKPFSDQAVFLCAIEQLHFMIVEYDFRKYLLNPEKISYEEFA